MKQASTTFSLSTSGPRLYEVTAHVVGWVRSQGMETGLLTIFCKHTSASLLIQENAAPEVRDDIETYFAQLAPEAPGKYAHDDEGDDDMPAHLRAALTNVSLSIPIIAGRLQLGTWQGIYLFEHRHASQQRQLALHVIGE